MVRIDFKCPVECIQSFMFEFGSASDIGCSTNLRVSTCHYNYYINLPDGNSFYIGFCPNWIKEKSSQSTHGIIEFNPNKVMVYPRFRELFNLLRSSSMVWDILRYDLACDIPIERSMVYTFKDQRKYSLIYNSNSDKTEYLGARNHHGFVKVYNKQLESKLDSPLTRIELTLSYGSSIDDINAIMPRVLIFDDLQFDFTIKDTDMVLCIACIDNPDLIGLLGRKKKKKINNILSSLVNGITIDFGTYEYISNILEGFRCLLY